MRRQSVRRAISACNGYLYEFPKAWSVSNNELMDEIKRYKKTKKFDFSFLEKAIEWKDVETDRYLAWCRDSNDLELVDKRSNQTEFYMVALTDDIMGLMCFKKPHWVFVGQTFTHRINVSAKKLQLW